MEMISQKIFVKRLANVVPIPNEQFLHQYLFYINGKS